MRGRRGQSSLSGMVSATSAGVLARAIGYVKLAVVGAAAGLSLHLDAYYVSVSVLSMAMFTFGDVFDSLGVPRLTESLRDGGEAGFRRTAGELVWFSMVLAGALCAAAFCLSGLAVRVLAPGFGPEAKARVAANLVVMIPAAASYLPLHALGSVLRSRRRFRTYYRAEVVSACASLAAVLGLGVGGAGLACAFAAGSLAAAAYMALSGSGECDWSAARDGAALRFWAAGLFSLLPVYAVGHVYAAVDRMFASWLPPGSIAALSYAMVLAYLPVVLLPIDGVFLTALSEASDRGARLRRIVRGTLLVSVPAAAALGLFSEDLVRLSFERGAFDGSATALTARLLSVFAVGLPALMAAPVMYRVCQIERAVRPMTCLSLGMVLVNVALNAASVAWGFGAVGLAAVNVAVWYASVAGLLAILLGRGVSAVDGETAGLLGAAACAALAGTVAASCVGSGHGLAALAARSASFLGVGGLAYLLCPVAGVREAVARVCREAGLGRPA